MQEFISNYPSAAEKDAMRCCRQTEEKQPLKGDGSSFCGAPQLPPLALVDIRGNALPSRQMQKNQEPDEPAPECLFKNMGNGMSHRSQHPFNQKTNAISNVRRPIRMAKFAYGVRSDYGLFKIKKVHNPT